ncbi:MAG: hypothetical protein SOY67_06835 [Collinsella sp.]|nr:hypothetical protein [Collinsella sp.]
MRGGSMTRRRAVQLALAGAAAWGSMPRAAAAAADSDTAAATGSHEAFTSVFTAWPGYATTMRGSLVPGAVPVSAPASDAAAWSLDAPEGAVAVPLALRQTGQATYIYALMGQDLVKLDAATGAKVGGLALPGPASDPVRSVFVDAMLIVALADGRLAAVDEDLTLVWTSGGSGLDPTDAGLLATAPLGVGDRVIAAAASDGAAERRITLSSLAPFDGSALATASLTAPASPLAASPQLIRMGDATALFCDGIRAAHLIDASAERPFEDAPSIEIPQAAPGCLRLASVPVGLDGGVAVVGVSSDGSASEFVLLSASPAADTGAANPAPALALTTTLELGVGVPACDPVVFAGRAVAVLGDAADQGGYRAVLIDLDAAPALIASVDLPSLAGPLAPIPLATACGPRTAEAAVEVVIADAAGAVVSLALDAPASREADMRARLLREPSERGLATAPSPLATREGTVLIAAPTASSSQLVALAPDADRAAATPVGGASGLDTIGGALAGATLPTGAGLGVGALVFAAAFGAYVLVRNRGGRARRDEGVDAWRARNRPGADDADAADDAGGRRP